MECRESGSSDRLQSRRCHIVLWQMAGLQPRNGGEPVVSVIKKTPLGNDQVADIARIPAQHLIPPCPSGFPEK